MGIGIDADTEAKTFLIEYERDDNLRQFADAALARTGLTASVNDLSKKTTDGLTVSRVILNRYYSECGCSPKQRIRELLSNKV
jgi:hypothetical protein